MNDTSNPTLAYEARPNDVPPLTPENAHVLNQAAIYRSGLRMLRGNAWFDIVVGLALAFICGGAVALAPAGPGTGLVVAIAAAGGLLAAVGIVTVVATPPWTMIAQGALMLISAVLIGWTHWRPVAPGSNADDGLGWFSIVIVAFLVVGGAFRLRRYAAFARASRVRPNRATLLWIDELNRVVQLGKPDRVENLIRFESNKLPLINLRALLIGDMAACRVNVRPLAFVPRDDLQIELEQAAGEAGKKVKAKLRLDSRETRGVMTRAEYERYARWRGDGDAAAVEAEIVEDDA